MRKKGILYSLRDLRRIGKDMQQSHEQLLGLVDLLELESVPECPSQFLISAASFEEIGTAVSECSEKDLFLQEATDTLFVDVHRWRRSKGCQRT